MSPFKIVLKSFLLTVAIVLLLQIQVGKKSLEMKAMNWIQSSSVTKPLRTIASSFSKLVNNSYKGATRLIRKNVLAAAKDDSDPGERLSKLKVERHNAKAESEEY